MDITCLDDSEIDYLARVLTLARDRGTVVRLSMDGGLKVAVGGGMWTPPMGKKAGPDGWPVDLFV